MLEATRLGSAAGGGTWLGGRLSEGGGRDMASLGSGMLLSCNWNGTESSGGLDCTSGIPFMVSECIGLCTAGIGLENESTVTVFSATNGGGATSPKGTKPEDRGILSS